jgi:hypothetical protein
VGKTSKDLFQFNIDTYKTLESVDHYTNFTTIKNVEKFLINKYLKEKILEMSCGRFTKCFHDQGFDFLGAEIVENMVKKPNKFILELISELETLAI